MNCKLSKESVNDLKFIVRQPETGLLVCASCKQPYDEHRNGQRKYRLLKYQR